MKHIENSNQIICRVASEESIRWKGIDVPLHQIHL